MSRAGNNPYARPDSRTRQAKQLGYAARSVFKLEEIDRRLSLLRRGQRVLDLGAAPGSWTQYASQRVGPDGHVLAIDLLEIPREMPPHVTLMTADVRSLEPTELARYGPFDIVLSDLAPRTSGSKVSDQTRSLDLFLLALNTAVRLGKLGSHFVGKLFMGPDYPLAERSVSELYSKTRGIRPQGTRQRSSELYLVGLGLRARPADPVSTGSPQDGLKICRNRGA